MTFHEEVEYRFKRGQQPRQIAKAMTERYQIVVTFDEIRQILAEVTSKDT